MFQSCIKFIVQDYEKGAEKIVELLTKDNSYISYVSFDIAKDVLDCLEE